MGQPTDGIIVAAFFLRHAQSHDARLKPGNDLGMADGRVGIFAQVLPHPGDSFAAHNVVGIDHVLKARSRGHVPADNDFRLRRKLAHHAAHLAHLADVDDDRRDADDVIFIGL